MNKEQHQPQVSAILMVLYAATLHLDWAVCISYSHAAVNATALDAVYRFIPSFNFLILALILSSVLSVFGLFSTRPWRWLFIFPQQIILLMSATGAISAMWTGHFADGVARSEVFIIADQSYAVITAICHTIALIYHARRD